ncbi:MAG: FkbM family methyltransferase [Terrimicrobiaceae bacterium]
MSKSTERKGLIHNLGKTRFVHHAMGKTRLYRLVNHILARWPMQKTLPRSGAVIRISSIAGLALAEEMFCGGSYFAAINKHEIRTFADLGCNVGWFPCLLLEALGNVQLKGLLVDADPAVVAEAEWHLKRNGLLACDAITGALGCESGTNEIVFHINPANTQSSTKPFGVNHPFPIKGALREILVPALELSKEWTQRHGDTVIDLLKIDIEGAELDFLRKEIHFICRAVRGIVCEWHDWHVSLPEIESFLKENGFLLDKIAEQDQLGGVAIFSRSSP